MSLCPASVCVPENVFILQSGGAQCDWRTSVASDRPPPAASSNCEKVPTHWVMQLQLPPTTEHYAMYMHAYSFAHSLEERWSGDEYASIQRATGTSPITYPRKEGGARRRAKNLSSSKPYCSSCWHVQSVLIGTHRKAVDGSCQLVPQFWCFICFDFIFNKNFAEVISISGVVICDLVDTLCIALP
jgi:hypothetical protein